jgi:hypothetical protein
MQWLANPMTSNPLALHSGFKPSVDRQTNQKSLQVDSFLESMTTGIPSFQQRKEFHELIGPFE